MNHADLKKKKERGEIGVLDVIEQEVQEAENGIDSLMLTEDQKESYRVRLKNLKKTRKKQTSRVLESIPCEEATKVSVIIKAFDPERCSKKEIRMLRKSLQELSVRRYPKKRKK